MSNQSGKTSATHSLECLLAAARESRLVVFAGAGVSIGTPTNLPAWRDVNRIIIRSLAAASADTLGMPLATRAADLILARHAQEKLPPEYQAQVLADFLHGRYFEVLRFLDSDRPNATHLTIAWLARLGCIRAVITTNFDRVIETAFAAVGTPYDCFFLPAHFAALAGNPDQSVNLDHRCMLIKLHGSVDDPVTLIDTLAQRKQGFPAPVLDCIRHLLHSCHWLFLGFSGLDLEAEPNYLTLAQEADHAAGFTWLVRTGSEPKPAVVRLKNLYRERGSFIRGDLPDWLLDFTDLLSAEPRRWIANHLIADPHIDSAENTRALEIGARDWAAGLTPEVSALALTFVVMASAEPQTAAQLAERTLLAIDECFEANPKPGPRELLLKGVAANALGTLFTLLGRHDEAVHQIEAAVAAAEAAGDEDTRNRFRGNLGISLETLGRIDEARHVYESVVDGHRRLDNAAPLAYALTALASHLIRQCHLDQARYLAEEAIGWAKVAGDEVARGGALNDLGLIAKLSSDYPAAANLFAEVEEIFLRLGNDDAVAAAMSNQGEVLAALGHFDQALRLQQSALKINERLGRHDNIGSVLLGLGVLEQQRSNLTEAETWFSKALELFRHIKDPSNQALALCRLAEIKAQGGDLEVAIELAESALPLVDERNAVFTSNLWNQIGKANMQLGYLGRAEEAFRRIHRFSATRGLTNVKAAAAMNLGTILLLGQRNDEATALFEESAAYWVDVNDNANHEYCELGLATVRLDQQLVALSEVGHATHDPEQQRAAATEMVALYPDLIVMYEKVGAQQLVGETCAYAASTAEFAGALDKAVEWYRQAATILHEIGLTPRAQEQLTRCEALLRRWANAMLQKQLLDAALPILLQLAEVATTLSHNETAARALLNAAVITLETSANYPAARRLAEEALSRMPADSEDAASAQRLIILCDSRSGTTE